MKKFYSAFLCLGIILGLFSSCNDDNDCPGVDPKAPIINITSGNLSMNIGDSIILKANSISLLPTTYSWSMDSVEVSTDSIFVFKKNYSGDFEVQLTATNEKGSTVSKTQIHVNPGKYKEGTFIINEGSSSPGSLIFINSQGQVTNKAYELENGGKLGNACQDLFIQNHKMYIVAQNGGNEGGYLTIINAETLKKERAFQEELSDKVSWPTHIAVLNDDNIYLRDNNGIKRFQPSTGEVTLIEGSQKARKNTMAVCNGKIFAAVDKTVVVIEQGQDAITNTIQFEGKVSGVIKASDGNLWVSDANGKIYKIDSGTYAEIGSQYVGDEAKNTLSAGWAATPSITAKGDTLYMNGSGTKIYRHVFSTGETKLMVDVKDMVENAGMAYNTVAVNPLTGEVIFNSIKGYGQDYKINNISVFDFSGEEPVLKANHENYTEFPGGTFFTYNFE